MSVVAKASALFRVLETMGPAGASMGELTGDTGLPRPTAYRILSQLAEEGITVNERGRWFLRSLTQPHLGVEEFEIIDRHLHALATATHVTVYAAALQEGHAHYVARADGDSPIKVFTVRVGESKRLATSYAGIALLAGCTRRRQEAEIEHVVHNLPPRWVVSPTAARTALWQMLRDVQDKGWCGRYILIPHVAGLAAPVPGTQLALAISGVTADIPVDTHEELSRALLATCQTLGEQLCALSEAHTPEPEQP